MAKKETQHILRDMRTVYMALGIPLVLLLLFGYALTTDVEDVALALVDRDNTAASRRLVQILQNSSGFEVVTVLADPADAEEVFELELARCALIIERGFGKALDRNDEAAVQLLVDGTNANDASIAIGFAVQAGAWFQREQTSEAMARMGLGTGNLKSPISIQNRNWFNQALRSQWYLVPGLIAVILAMINTMLMALTVAREWEKGTMEQLLVTPVSRGEIVLGKLIPYLLIGLGQLVLISSAGVLLFDLPLRGNIPLLLGISTLFLLAGLGQGLLISVVTRNQQLAMMFSFLSSMLPALLLSGFMSPIASMPRLIQILTHIIPSRYFLVVTRGIFLKGVGVQAIETEILAIAGFAVALILLSIKKFKTRLD
jgi:ABC-2 type transport system permease protein